MSSGFEPRDPDYRQRVRESFARQGLLATFAAQLETIEPGVVEIHVPFSTGLTQQDNFFHAGVGIAALDSACGYAALSLMAPARRVLTVELKVNLLSPAVGDFLIARGEVVRPGRNLTVCRGDAYAASDDGSKHVATMLATMTGVAERNA
jgi:uncharacterized protein (TIGR00369 family)